MTIRLTNEIMRWSLRFCCRRFPWKRLRVPVAASIREASLSRNDLIPVWGGRLNQNCLSGTLSAARFYSDGRNHNENLKESNSLPSEHSLSTDITPDQTSSEQRQRRSPFLELLHQCGSPSDVLDLTCKYSPTIRQVSNCLNHMWSSMKKMSDGQRRYELQLMFEHPEFENLLQRAMRSVQHMCNDDFAYSLLSMVNLGVPQRSRVIQTFLRTCQASSQRLSSTMQRHCMVFMLTLIYFIHQQERLNDFDEKTLSILASALEHMKDGQNVDALKEGMSLPNAQYMISTMAKMGFHSKPLLNVCGGKIKAAKLPKSTERMFQRVDLCLRLDRPPLPQPLTVPSSALGNPILNSPSVNLRLSKGLQSVLADQANAALQEMLVVENFYIIGEDAALEERCLSA
ncbi:hypothetical protein GOODEAATRI_014838 [Goodea atripinnis]|uniref:FAST kinase leucine-rich domain-containing protein n=1 Tax=Goodea atripinnis TaxID=208336 RepID=A0ABV0MST0_9TELE